jgi:hypothetical protein
MLILDGAVPAWFGMESTPWVDVVDAVDGWAWPIRLCEGLPRRDEEALRRLTDRAMLVE